VGTTGTYSYTQNGENGGENLWFMNGTSPAAAQVSGCCAIIRQVYCKFMGAYPSAAMVKALLVNGATRPVVLGSSRPAMADGDQGFGRVNMKNTIVMIHQTNLIDSHRFAVDYSGPKDARPLALNQVASFFPEVRRTGDTISATLVYPDTPGANLHNILTLDVTVTGTTPASDGETRWADPELGGLKSRAVNNCVKLVWTVTKPGLYIGTVHCDALDGQTAAHYAVCWSVS